MSLYVQFGCGLSCPDGWVNYDSSPTLRLQRLPLVGRAVTGGRTRFPAGVRYGDIVRGLPVAPGSCDGVYCSHVLEHLSLDECRTALRNTFTYLRGGGRFRLIVPDLETAAANYLAGVRAGDPQAAHGFVAGYSLGRTTRPRGTVRRLKETFSNVHHLYMWDVPSLTHELREAGFVEVKSVGPGETGDPHFLLAEDPLRYFQALALEAVKP